VATFHRVPNLAYAGARFPALGRLHSEPRTLGTFLRRLVAVGPIGLRMRQAARIDLGHGDDRRRWLHHQVLQHDFRLAAIVRVGPGDDNA
jgi:hypothetical protein